jgi:fructoselysine-6-P-deglycase FrlB-like protein
VRLLGLSRAASLFQLLSAGILQRCFSFGKFRHGFHILRERTLVLTAAFVRKPFVVICNLNLLCHANIMMSLCFNQPAYSACLTAADKQDEIRAAVAVRFYMFLRDFCIFFMLFSLYIFSYATASSRKQPACSASHRLHTFFNVRW